MLWDADAPALGFGFIVALWLDGTVLDRARVRRRVHAHVQVANVTVRVPIRHIVESVGGRELKVWRWNKGSRGVGERMIV